jgi:hypothetical protein
MADCGSGGGLNVLIPTIYDADRFGADRRGPNGRGGADTDQNGPDGEISGETGRNFPLAGSSA